MSLEVNNVGIYLTKQVKSGKSKWRLPTKAKNPMQTSYLPDLYASPELEPIDDAYYQSSICILLRMVDLGRVDICLELLMLPSHLDLPIEEHLKPSVLHFFISK